MKNKFNFRYCCLFLLIFAAAGCSRAHDPVKEEIVFYLAEVSKARYFETKALVAFNSIAGENYKNDAAMQDALKETVLPEYAKFKSEMLEIRPMTNDVSGLHRIYLKRVDLTLSAFQQLSGAIRKGDQKSVDEASHKLKLADVYLIKWKENINKPSK